MKKLMYSELYTYLFFTWNQDVRCLSNGYLLVNILNLVMSVYYFIYLFFSQKHSFFIYLVVTSSSSFPAGVFNCVFRMKSGVVWVACCSSPPGHHCRVSTTALRYLAIPSPPL